MATTSTYPTEHGSPRRDCVAETTTSAKGTISWSRGLDFIDRRRPVLTVWDGRLVVASAGTLAIFSSDGTELHRRARLPDSPTAAVPAAGSAPSLLYVVAGSFYLEAIDASGKLVKHDIRVPGFASSELVLGLLWPLESEFISSAALPDPKYDSEGDKPEPEPTISATRAAYGDPLGSWGEEWKGSETLPPLYVPGTHRVLLATDRGVASEDVQGPSPQKGDYRFKLPLAPAVAWSSDDTGLLAVTGTHDGHKVLLAISETGEEKWRWTDREGVDAWVPRQPPVRAASGRVSVLATRRVITVEAGKLVWQYDLKSEALRHGAQDKDGRLFDKDGHEVRLDTLRFATGLLDGSLLVSGDTRLRLIGPDGKERFVATLPGDIVTPPVVDAAGHIYVATAKAIHRID